MGLTRDNHSAATHDANDLHGTPLLQAHLPPLIQRPSQFGDEDQTEEPDGGRLGDQARLSEHLCVRQVNSLENALDIPHAKRQADADSEQGDED